jgi:hypothetical protein
VIAPGQGTVNTTALGNITNIASGNSNLTLQTGSGNTTAVTVDTSQNVLVNTTTGYGKFTVQNNAGTGKVLLDNYVSVPTTENVMSIYANATRGYIQSYNNGYKDIAICSGGGNVDIGTTDTGGRLLISRASVPTTYSKNTAYLQIGAAEETLNGYHLITFGYTTSASTYQPAFIGYTETSNSGNSAGALIFGTRSAVSDTTPTEAMRITSAGVVQVGNNSGTGEVFAQNTVKVWGVIIASTGALYNSFGLSSSSKISTGIFSIGFTRTLSSSRFGSGCAQYGSGFTFINTESTTGCRVNTQNSSGTYADGDVMFVISGGS